MKAPFPWFGGKSRVASLIWRRFGDTPNYVEAFAGSLAVLLARPHYRPGEPWVRTETVNDLNAWLTNFWRALASNPDEVALHASYPVSELDLHARGDAIFYRDDWYQSRGYESVEAWIEWVRADPGNYDPLIAGWWVWGQCAWIGDNWGRMSHNCRKDEAGEPAGVTHAKPHLDGPQGINRTGKGEVSRKRPNLSNAGRGVNRQMPHVGNAGQGMNRQMPHVGNAGRGVNPMETPRFAAIRSYLGELAARLATVRICCGDWTRVCGPTPTVQQGLTAVFLDPPYAVADRDAVYGEHESVDVAHDVRAWAVEHGADPRLRIALCGYAGEHVMPPDWECVHWKAKGGYGSQRRDGSNDNAGRERIWFSPACLKADLFTHSED